MEKLHILTNYDINEKTMALRPAAHIDYYTIVQETDCLLYVKKTPLQLIEAACLKGFCSYEGRRTAIVHLTGFKRKVPVPIYPDRNIYAFPTSSPTRFDCIWIFAAHVKSIKHDSATHILFNNEQELKVNESYKVLNTQIYRTAYCKSKMLLC